jgi:GT2 family glycosyltransferase
VRFPVRVLPQGDNLGFAAGCNRGFAAARGQFIVQLNNDAELQQGALARALQVLEEHPEAGSLALSMRFMDRPGVLNSTGLVVFRDGSARDRDFEVEVGKGPPSVGPVLGACGGAAVWRREVFEKVGPLDEEFFMYSEDLDMALRAQRAGYECLYVPDAVVLHRFGASVAREPAAWRLEMAHRNTARVLMRNLGALSRARALVTFAARVVTLRLRAGRAESKARAKAVAFLIRNRKQLGAQRRTIRALGADARVDRWMRAGGRG